MGANVMFWIGLGVGCLVMIIPVCLAIGHFDAEKMQFIRSHGYTFNDVLNAWQEGRDGKPPRPPAPRC
jgi:hypothetical protein